MFDRSKYNWAITQVQTSCKFEFNFDQETLDFVGIFLGNSDVFCAVKEARRAMGAKDWYQPIAGVVLGAANQCEFNGVKQKYAHVLAGCYAAAKQYSAGERPIDTLASAYEIVGLNPAELITH